MSKAVIVRRDSFERLAEALKEYEKRYATPDVKTLVLMLDAMGADKLRDHLAPGVQHSLRVVISQNPIYLLYLPALSRLFPEFLNIIEKIAKDRDFASRIYSTLEQKGNTLVLVERRLTLTSLAVASKYVRELDPNLYAGYLELWKEIMEKLLGAIKRQYDDLDPLEKVALLVLYEVQNIVRGYLKLTPLKLPPIDEVLREIENQQSQVLRIAAASLLYDLYTIRGQDYLFGFYQLLSSVNLEATYQEIRRAEKESIEDIRGLSLYEDDLAGLSLPLSEVEFSLIMKLINTAFNASVLIPIIYFTDFICMYYHLPKNMLKLWLQIMSMRYRVQSFILRYPIPLILSFVTFIASELFHEGIQALIIRTSLSGIIGMVINYLIEKFKVKFLNKVVKKSKEYSKEYKSKAEAFKLKAMYFDFFVPS